MTVWGITHVHSKGWKGDEVNSSSQIEGRADVGVRVPCFLHGAQSIAHGVRLSARWFVVRLKPHAPLVWSRVLCPSRPIPWATLWALLLARPPPSSRGGPLDLGLGHLEPLKRLVQAGMARKWEETKTQNRPLALFQKADL